MKAAGMFAIGHASNDIVPGEMSLEEMLHSMPVLEMDSLAGAYKIGKLKKSWPFDQAVNGPNPANGLVSTDSTAAILLRLSDTSLASSLQASLAHAIVFEKLQWEDAMDTLYDFYIGRKDWSHAAKVVEALSLEHPTEAAFYEKAANIYGELKDNENAAFYFRRSFTLYPSFEKARNIFVLYLKLDRPSEALPFLDYAIRNNTTNLNLTLIKQFVEQVIQMQQAARKSGPSKTILLGIASKYIAMGNHDAATRYADSVLKTDPGNKVALALKTHEHS